MYRAYSRVLASHPYRTNVITGGALGFTADLICQGMEQNTWHPKVNARRVFALTSFGFIWTGFITTKIFSMYPRLVPTHVAQSPMRLGLASTLMDNCINVPFAYTPAYYLWTGTLQGHPIDQIKQRFRDAYGTSVVTCWCMWVPLQFVNLGFVPEKSRVILSQSAGLVWSVLLDWIAHNSGGDEPVLPTVESNLAHPSLSITATNAGRCATS